MQALSRQRFGGKAMCDLCRRNFIRGFAAFGAAAAIPSPLFAQAESVRRPPADIGPPALPPRGEFVFRNAHVMTMDAALGDIPGGSVHVRNGEIVAVGQDINAPGARVIAGDDMIVLPGLVETHWHMWNTLFRSY
jgi:5-methylthioadenosine/S-adenosylhomocysteine deaminase